MGAPVGSNSPNCASCGPLLRAKTRLRLHEPWKYLRTEDTDNLCSRHWPPKQRMGWIVVLPNVPSVNPISVPLPGLVGFTLLYSDTTAAGRPSVVYQISLRSGSNVSDQRDSVVHIPQWRRSETPLSPHVDWDANHCSLHGQHACILDVDSNGIMLFEHLSEQ